MAGEQMTFFKTADEERAEAYFDKNPDLLAAFDAASEVMERHTGVVSARGLMEFARWYRKVGSKGMYELLECFEGVIVRGEDVAAMPNAYSAWLTRHFESNGRKVTKARSKLDVWGGRE